MTAPNVLTLLRTFILVTVVLYAVIGVEIVKRRRELQSITTDSVPLDDVVTQAHEAAESFDDGMTTTAASVESQPDSYGKYNRYSQEPVCAFTPSPGPL